MHDSGSDFVLWRFEFYAWFHYYVDTIYCFILSWAHSSIQYSILLQVRCAVVIGAMSCQGRRHFAAVVKEVDLEVWAVSPRLFAAALLPQVGSD